jgi:hypothetical protein
MLCYDVIVSAWPTWNLVFIQEKASFTTDGLFFEGAKFLLNVLLEFDWQSLEFVHQSLIDFKLFRVRFWTHTVSEFICIPSQIVFGYLELSDQLVKFIFKLVLGLDIFNILK